MPQCCPSRASWYTGRMSKEHGVPVNGLPIDRRLPDTGAWLREHGGYDTFYTGKWHIPGRNPKESFTVLPGGGQGASRITSWSVDPKRNFPRRDFLWAPMIIRSAPPFSAASRMNSPRGQSRFERGGAGDAFVCKHGRGLLQVFFDHFLFGQIGLVFRLKVGHVQNLHRSAVRLGLLQTQLQHLVIGFSIVVPDQYFHELAP